MDLCSGAGQSKGRLQFAVPIKNWHSDTADVQLFLFVVQGAGGCSHLDELALQSLGGSNRLNGVPGKRPSGQNAPLGGLRRECEKDLPNSRTMQIRPLSHIGIE